MEHGIREATKKLHDELEALPFNQKMFRGELTREERLSWLAAQLNVFELLDPHVREDLRRSDLIRQDIEALGGKNVWAPAAYWFDLKNNVKGRLDGHIYLNYMGLLYGGQIMSERYPESSRLYQFDDVKGARKYIRETFVQPHETEEWFVFQVRNGFQMHIRQTQTLQREHNVE